jgi:ABC-type spermidine/putrescine transport system permease subunit II
MKIFYDYLEYFMAIWHKVWQFGIVRGHLVYFLPFWYVWTKKNLATVVDGRIPNVPI